MTLESLQISAIDCIEKHLREFHAQNERNTTLKDECPFLHDGNDIGILKYAVHQERLSPSFAGSYDEAPYGSEVEQRIQSIEVFEIYGHVHSVAEFLKSNLNRSFRMMWGRKINC